MYECLDAGVNMLIQPAGNEEMSVWLYKLGSQLSQLLRLDQSGGQDLESGVYAYATSTLSKLIGSFLLF